MYIRPENTSNDINKRRSPANISDLQPQVCSWGHTQILISDRCANIVRIYLIIQDLWRPIMRSSATVVWLSATGLLTSYDNQRLITNQWRLLKKIGQCSYDGCTTTEDILKIRKTLWCGFGSYVSATNKRMITGSNVHVFILFWSHGQQLAMTNWQPIAGGL